MQLSPLYFYSWLFLLLPYPPQETKTLTTADAKAHLGETVKVCRVVASLYEPRRSRRNPAILNFDQPYPRNKFAASIWRWQRPAFGDLCAWVNKKPCVKYREQAQMTLRTVSA